MTEIVAADIGGTHARFALARVSARCVVELVEPLILRAADYPGLAAAWAAFGATVAHPLPRAAAIAVAAPPGDIYKFTNSDWVVRPATLAADLGLDAFTLINDFGAVGHAVAALDPAHFRHVCGPDIALPLAGQISIIGPGTGLGVAQLLRSKDHYHVIATEGGHIGFSPVDDLEERIAARVTARHGRTSIERLVSGAGLAPIAETLAADASAVLPPRDDKQLWIAALSGSDPLLTEAVAVFCRIWGSITGDLALAHGAHAVVLAGGIGARLAERLPASGFAERFTAKGRYAARQAALPVRIIIHPEPGLYGAATAFAREHLA
ncbi:MAG: glucokinase [Polymorphobacter sp.]